MDETRNWTDPRYPADTTQDNLYHALLAGYAFTDYEFDSLVRRPVLADFAPYSTVVWHTDDRDYYLLHNDTTALRAYLAAGGKLWLTGWLPLADARNGATYPASFGAGSFVYDCLNISQAAQTNVTADTFIAGRGLAGYPDVLVDSAKVPLATWKGTLRYIEALTPVPPAEMIYTIDMRNNGSPFEGQTCGIRYLGADYRLAYTAFPLSFMRQDEARALAVRVMTDFGETGVDGKPADIRRPSTFRLAQNTPNPFTSYTSINYELPARGIVELAVYNVAGQKVRTLVKGPMPAGNHRVRWDGRNESKRSLSAGIYILRLNVGGHSKTRKLMLVR